MKTMEDLKDMLQQELKDVVKKGDISSTELDNVYKAVKTLNYLEIIKAMEEQGGQSRDYSGRMYGGSYDSYNSRGSYEGSRDGGSYGSYNRGGSYDRGSYDSSRDGSYAEDYSGRRGRGMDGRYVSRDGYSGHTKEHVIADMEDMMRTASPEEKKAIRACIEKLENA